ncbi:hypothetical protein DFJ73DRAFT_642244, partial [Zopfochytrium polystomum]
MSTRTERFADKSLNDKHTRILKELMQRSDNRRCADCRKKGTFPLLSRSPDPRADPRWASWNLGIFVCIRCSGVHRSMGTHISKVKSADLDTWTPEQIENMIKWGNAKANFYWEGELPPNFEPPESGMDQWIRAKYDRKQYVRKGPIPNPEDIPLPEGVSAIQITGAPTSTKRAPPVVASVLSSPPKPATPAAASSPAKPATSAEDLFEAFQSPPTPSAPAAAGSASPQVGSNLKANIMSLYTAPPAPTQSAVNPSLISGMALSSTPPFSPTAGAPAPPQPQGAEFFSQPSFANFSAFSTFSAASPTSSTAATAAASRNGSGASNGSLSFGSAGGSSSGGGSGGGGIPNFG